MRELLGTQSLATSGISQLQDALINGSKAGYRILREIVAPKFNRVLPMHVNVHGARAPAPAYPRIATRRYLSLAHVPDLHWSRKQVKRRVHTQSTVTFQRDALIVSRFACGVTRDITDIKSECGHVKRACKLNVKRHQKKHLEFPWPPGELHLDVQVVDDIRMY